MDAYLAWIFALTTLLAGLLPPLWLAVGGCRSRRQWLGRSLLAGSVELLAVLAAPWPLLSLHLRPLFLLLFIGAAWLRLRRTPRGRAPAAGAGRLALPLLLLPLTLANLLALAARLPAGEALELSFPLRGGTFCVLQGGGSPLANPFHWRTPGERLAIDLVQLHPSGNRAAGIAPARLEDYASFGAPVASPCEGVVLRLRDDLPDQPPGRPDPLHSAGNHLLLACGDAEVLLAHLRQGSVVVRPGQAVRPGEPLGRIGNSGNTSEPHLHLGATRHGKALAMRFDGAILVINDRVRN